jgi:hypothetical protein
MLMKINVKIKAKKSSAEENKIINHLFFISGAAV